MRAKILGVALTVIGIASCATLSEQECHTADWQTIGFEDGSRGYHRQRIGAHREACSEYGVKPDFKEYIAGHELGVQQYCTYRNGLLLGKSGSDFNEVCSTLSSNTFSQGFRDGRALFDINAELNAIKEDYDTTLNEITRFQEEINSKQEMVIAQSTGPVLRRELLAQIEVLKESIAYRELTLDKLAHQQMRLEQRYAQFEKSTNR